MPGPLGTALEYVVSGTYQFEEEGLTNRTFTAGTEFELGLLATHMVAASEDSLLSWIRYRWWLWGSDEVEVYEWFILKCKATDALQDLSDETVIEQMQRDKAIVKRGICFTMPQSVCAPALHTAQLYKVSLPRGYELRHVIRPLVSGVAEHGKSICLLEWRQVGA